MLHDFKVDSAFYLAMQFHKIARATKGVIVVSGLIRSIALDIGVDPSDQQTTISNSWIDLKACLTMKIIICRRDIYYLAFKNTTLPLPNSEHTSVCNKNNWKVVVDVDSEKSSLCH